MDALETSPGFPSSQHSQISPTGTHIATLDGLRLDISLLTTFEIVRTVTVPQSPAKFLAIKWAPIGAVGGSSDRFLLADEDTVRVWDVQDAQWSATIHNGSGSMGKIANVEFGSDDDEVMVFSSFGGKITVFSLCTGRSIEVNDTKFATKGHGRGNAVSSNVFALLTRPAAQDVITLHASSSYATFKTFTLPSTDAQGLKWSPNGRWLAVWDAPIYGCKIFIYTADGNLYRTYTGDYFDALTGLGLKTLEWSSDGNYLAVAGYERDVVLLSTRTFVPAVHLAYKCPLKPTCTAIWLEQATGAARSYSVAAQMITPPTAPTSTSETRPALGVSILSFNSDCSLLAAKDDSMPTTVWIWDLVAMTLYTVLIQHSMIKRITWHPTDRNLLLIQSSQAEAMLYLWDARLNEPRILLFPLLNLSSRVEAQWVPGQERTPPRIMYGDAHECMLAWPEGKGVVPDPMTITDDDTHSVASDAASEDSLYAILSPKKPAPTNDETQNTFHGDLDTVEEGLAEDTFQFRKGVGVY